MCFSFRFFAILFPMLSIFLDDQEEKSTDVFYLIIVLIYFLVFLANSIPSR